MARWLKRGMDVTAIKAADAKVRETVESILADIEARKDQAVRDLSKKFDNWEPKSFRLTDQEIDKSIAQVGKRDLEDIKFAQAQVRNFAQKQRDCIKDLEVETLPGVVLGHRNIPIASVGCLQPEGQGSAEGRFDARARVERMRGTQQAGGQIDPADRRRALLREVIEHRSNALQQGAGWRGLEITEDAGADDFIDPLSRPRLRPVGDGGARKLARLVPLGSRCTQKGGLRGDFVTEMGERLGEARTDSEAHQACLESGQIHRLPHTGAEQGLQRQSRR